MPTWSWENGFVKARCNRLVGGHYSFDMATVTGTENVLMAATLGAALPSGQLRAGPEILDLATA